MRKDVGTTGKMKRLSGTGEVDKSDLCKKCRVDFTVKEYLWKRLSLLGNVFREFPGTERRSKVNGVKGN